MPGTHAVEQAPAVPVARRAATATMSAAGLAADRPAGHDDREFPTFWRQAKWINGRSNLSSARGPRCGGPRGAWRTCGRFRGRCPGCSAVGIFRAGSASSAGSTRCWGEGPERPLLRPMPAGGSLLQTMIDHGQLTMRKAGRGIAALCAGLVEDEAICRRIFARLEAELGRTQAAILAVTGPKQLLGASRCCGCPSSCAIRPSIRRIPSRSRCGGGWGPQKKLPGEEAETARAVVEPTSNGISGGLKNTG